MDAIRGTAQPQLHKVALFFTAMAAALLLAVGAYAARAWTSSSVVGTTAPAVHHTTLVAPASLPDRSDTQVAARNPAPLPDRSDVQGPPRASRVDAVGCQLVKVAQGRIAC